MQERVTVRAIAGGGDGVATMSDGRTVFVPRSAPGDEVLLRDVKRHARYARAEIAELLTPAADRVEPPCPHYVVDRCGSCQLMHLSVGAQHHAKARIAGDALRRIGQLEIDDPPVTAAPHAFDYRSKVTFTVQQGRIGYHRLNQPGRIFDVRECLIAAPGIRALHAALRSARQHLPRNDARVVLRIDRSGGRHVIVRTGAGDAWTGGASLHGALADAGVSARIWWHPEGGTARAVAGADDPWPATVFEQVHPEVARQVRQAAINSLAPMAGQHAWDLYAGVGDSTAALVTAGATVESVESDRRAVEVAERLGPAGPRRVTGLVEALVRTLEAPDIVIANPPRAGMAEGATSALAASGAVRIAYISCDPATLARDLARLADHYRVASVRVFDQFPQTAHLECLAVLERR